MGWGAFSTLRLKKTFNLVGTILQERKRRGKLDTESYWNELFQVRKKRTDNVYLTPTHSQFLMDVTMSTHQAEQYRVPDDIVYTYPECTKGYINPEAAHNRGMILKWKTHQQANGGLEFGPTKAQKVKLGIIQANSS